MVMSSLVQGIVSNSRTDVFVAPKFHPVLLNRWLDLVWVATHLKREAGVNISHGRRCKGLWDSAKFWTSQPSWYELSDVDNCPFT